MPTSDPYEGGCDAALFQDGEIERAERDFLVELRQTPGGGGEKPVERLVFGRFGDLHAELLN